MANNQPLVSVVIPSKNRPDFLMEALESVFAQTYQNLEVIVVDDGSTPSLKTMLKSRYGDRILFLRHEQSLGAPAARNAGARLASGEFIAFLDDDDLWLPDKLKTQLAVFLNQKTAISLVFCGEALLYKGEICGVFTAKWDKRSRVSMLKDNIIGGTSSVVARRECILASGGFDESLSSCQDWDLWLRISQVEKVAFVPSILVHRNVHGTQISSTLGKRLAGREAFLEKHIVLISQHPIILAQHLRRIGCLKVAGGKRSEAGQYFARALKAYPRAINSWLCLAINTFLPQNLRVKLLSKYAITKFAETEIYH